MSTFNIGDRPFPAIIHVNRGNELRRYAPERTCEMVDNGRELCCSVCDWRHDYDDEPVYCSGCGAKVVDNGA